MAKRSLLHAGEPRHLSRPARALYGQLYAEYVAVKQQLHVLGW